VKKKIILAILIISSFLYSKEVAVISSFNSLHLGWKGKSYYDLASVISLFDLVGLEEVMKEDGLSLLKNELEKITGEKWSYCISEHSVGNSKRYQEYYGYIWKDKKVKLTKKLGFYKEHNPKDLSREPYGANFEIGEFDFSFILMHSIFGDKKMQRENEAKFLDEIYDYFQEKNGSEQDVLIGGDFNIPAYDKAFLEILNHKDNIFYGIDPTNKTTIGKRGLVSSYDNIFYSYKYTKEFTGNSGVYDFTNKNYSTIRKRVSDHLPVFMEFNINKDDD